MHVTQTMPETETARTILRDTSDQRIIIGSGYDVRLTVRAGQLCLIDGVRTGRRTRMISGADSIRRIILLTDTGYLTFEAMRWCHAENILVTQYDRDGQLIMHSGTPINSPDIVLAQSLASAGMFPELTLSTIRATLTSKLEGQSSITAELFNAPHATKVIHEMMRYIDKADTGQQLMGYEGVAAKIYWKQWVKQIHIPWKTTVNLPIHWIEPFAGRKSGTRNISNRASKSQMRTIDAPESSSRGATDPINAMINYAYRIAETEAMYACLTHGLNPGIGLHHSTDDRRNNPLALDLMEAARPICDRIVLDIIQHNVFDPRWCYEAKHGIVRLYPPLTHMISEQCATMARSIEPHAAALRASLKAIRVPKLSASKESPSIRG